MSSSQSNGDEFKLFVGGLNWCTDEESLKKHFEQFGAIQFAEIKKDRENGRPRGFGFVVFQDQEGVDKALAQKEKGGHLLDDKYVDPKLAQKGSTSAPVANKVSKVFVGGVPPEMQEATIRDHFAQFGDIKDVALVTEGGEPNKRRGFVFVEFVSNDSADRAIEHNQFHEIEDNGTKIRVEVKKASPREFRGGRGEAQRSSGPYGGEGGRGTYNGSNNASGYNSGVGYHYATHGGGYPPAGGYSGGYAGGYTGSGGYSTYTGGYSGGYSNNTGSYDGGYSMGPGGYNGGNSTNTVGYSGGGQSGGYGAPTAGVGSQGGTAGSDGAGYRNEGRGGPTRSNYHQDQGSASHHPYRR